MQSAQQFLKNNFKFLCALCVYFFALSAFNSCPSKFGTIIIAFLAPLTYSNEGALRMMTYRMLGKTNLRVSEIGFGAWAIGGPVDLFGIPVGWGTVDDRDSIAAIKKALEVGITFFDTADVYGEGHSEELLGECLEGNRECVIATKVGNARTARGPVKDFSEKHIRESLEGSLRRLRRDVIDVYQLHNPPPDVLDKDDVFDLLEDLKKEGKIKAIGVSITTIGEGIYLIERRKVQCLQVLFNILNQEPAKKLIPLAETYGVGIIARVPLASGLLTGKFGPEHRFAKDDNRANYLTPKRLQEALEKVEKLKQLIKDSGLSLPQVALAFLLRFPAVNSAIPGAKTPAQVEQNASASLVELPAELFDAIRKEFGDYNFFIRYNVRI
jgi:aryl-alcohol dehydrogenase-like predicted oxidoreductase